MAGRDRSGRKTTHSVVQANVHSSNKPSDVLQEKWQCQEAAYTYFYAVWQSSLTELTSCMLMIIQTNGWNSVTGS